MNYKFLFALLGTGLFMAACSSNSNEAYEESTEAVSYKLDKTGSTLKWAANMSPEYGHKGTVSITDGALVMQGDELVSGSFVIDMTTIKSTDLEEPKAGILAGHLMGTLVDEDHPADLFFQTEKYPTIEVELGSYKDGKLSMTLDILGKKLEQKVDVTLKSSEKEASLKGKFSLDLTSLKVPGLQPNPEDGSQINPKIDFDLNVLLKK